MRIFITNDDGYNSGGIAALTALAMEFSDDVIVVAPDKTYSGMSHAITMHAPLFVEEVAGAPDGLRSYICAGTPVDCVKIAFDEIMKNEKHPDLVLSGINHGSNSNISVIYSGTMGAATEATFYGIPAVGISLTDHSPDANFDGAVFFARKIIQQVLEMSEGEKRNLCLNVNVPNINKEDIKGVKYCRQTKGCWKEDFVARKDPHGRDYYWMHGKFYNDEPEATDTDEWALKNGYVAVVPVQMDLTDYNRLAKLQEKCAKY